MSLREQMLKDIQQTFMNAQEFAEDHTVTTYTDEAHKAGRKDRQLSMIIERFTFDGRPIQSAEGVSAHNVIIHIDPVELAYTPRGGQSFYLDFMRYTVMGVSNDMGMLKVILQANGTGP